MGKKNVTEFLGTKSPSTKKAVKEMTKISDDQKMSALDEAQELIYKAWDADTERGAKILANKALEISPDCVDAYNILGDYTENLDKAIEYYRKGVEAGERVLGKEVFEEMKGHFWGFVETRPYMRAKKSLAEGLLIKEEVDEAIRHLGHMLELNPNDNQGVRYILMGALIRANRDDDAFKLFDQYEEETTEWLYSLTLLNFRKYGNSPEAGEALLKSIESNMHVMMYLLGAKELPKQMPASYQLGSEEEAISYVYMHADDWFQTPGAIDWMIGVAEKVIEMAESGVFPEDVEQPMKKNDIPKIVEHSGDTVSPADLMRFSAGADYRNVEKEMARKSKDRGNREMTDLDRAQELIYRAWEADTDMAMKMLAKKALKITPDCVDGYLILAELEDDIDKELDLYRKAVEAGERAIGKEGFKEMKGNFWHTIETRPYMRAKQQLADCLAMEGRYEEAAVQYRHMLELNPNDNQGVRDFLMGTLICLDRDEEAFELLNRYREEVTSGWHFTAALLNFRKYGNSRQAFTELDKAMARNEFVVPYLIGILEMPVVTPEMYKIGSEEEAVAYYEDNIDIWLDSPGALEWLIKLAMKAIELAGAGKSKKNLYKLID